MYEPLSVCIDVSHFKKNLSKLKKMNTFFRDSQPLLQFVRNWDNIVNEQGM